MTRPPRPLDITAWQLRSIAGDALIADVAARRRSGGATVADGDALVDRAFAVDVLAAVTVPLYLADGWLRGDDRSGGTPIAALAAAERFGAAAVEEAVEKGSVAV